MGAQWRLVQALSSPLLHSSKSCHSEHTAPAGPTALGATIEPAPLSSTDDHIMPQKMQSNPDHHGYLRWGWQPWGTLAGQNERLVHGGCPGIPNEGRQRCSPPCLMQCWPLQSTWAGLPFYREEWPPPDLPTGQKHGSHSDGKGPSTLPPNGQHAKANHSIAYLLAGAMAGRYYMEGSTEVGVPMRDGLTTQRAQAGPLLCGRPSRMGRRGGRYPMGTLCHHTGAGKLCPIVPCIERAVQWVRGCLSCPHLACDAWMDNTNRQQRASLHNPRHNAPLAPGAFSGQWAC